MSSSLISTLIDHVDCCVSWTYFLSLIWFEASTSWTFAPSKYRLWRLEVSSARCFCLRFTYHFGPSCFVWTCPVFSSWVNLFYCFVHLSISFLLWSDILATIFKWGSFFLLNVRSGCKGISSHDLWWSVYCTQLQGMVSELEQQLLFSSQSTEIKFLFQHFLGLYWHQNTKGNVAVGFLHNKKVCAGA